MDIFDKFFQRFAYKFDKGYPDMNNAQDVLLLETLIEDMIDSNISLEETALSPVEFQELKFLLKKYKKEKN